MNKQSDRIDWLFTIADLLSWLSGVISRVDNLLAPVWEILANVWPAAIVTVGAIVLVWFVRWLRLRWRGRSPRVQITNFAWAAADSDDHDEAEWVTSLFREQLAALRLDALDPLPERAPGAPLVEIVEGVGQGVAHSVDIGKAIGRLFKAVWSDAAYEVWGTLRREDSKHRVSVQLVDRGRGNRTLVSVTLSEASWEQSARQAAMAVAGALYPRVSRRHSEPWGHWKESVPRQLISDYHEGRAHADNKRLEHAMGAFHAALDRDPLNPHLRMRIAMLQERLALDLDAWVTYRAIVDEADRGAWRGQNRRVRLFAVYRLAILLGNGRVAKQWVKRISVPEPDLRERDKEREKLRRELLIALKRDPLLTATKPRSKRRWKRGLATASVDELLDSLPTGKAQAGVSPILAPFDAPRAETERGREIRVERINEVLGIISLRCLKELDAWLRIRPPWRPRQWRDWWLHRPPLTGWLRRRELSRRVIAVSKLLARTRIAASVERRLGEEQANHKAVEKVRKAHRKLTQRWPFPPTGRWWLPFPTTPFWRFLFPTARPWRLTVRWLAPRLRWANRRADAWQLHYNAACATASVLLDGSVLGNVQREQEERAKQRAMAAGEAQTDAWALEMKAAAESDAAAVALTTRMSIAKVVRSAVEELEEYAHRAGSRRVAAQADWVAIDDPDLRGLADKDAFKAWASHHLPRGLPEARPHRNIDVNRYTARIVCLGARAFAQTWHERARNDAAAAESVATWWREERVAWVRLSDVCRELRSWRCRLAALEALESWWRSSGRRDQIDFGHEDRGRTVDTEKVNRRLFGRIEELVGDARSPGSSPCTTVLYWANGRAADVQGAYESGAERVDRSPLIVARERQEALKAARIWTRLADVLEVELKGGQGGSGSEDTSALLESIQKEFPVDAAGVGDGTLLPSVYPSLVAW